jgi:PadR family transcriptional regulator, regulatory protein PadR
MRRTHALVQVAVVLSAAPFDKHWGYDLTRQSGVRSGVLYPILHRMFDMGWLSDGWEDTESSGPRRRPPRRYYELTDTGRRELGALLTDACSDPRFVRLLGGATA